MKTKQTSLFFGLLISLSFGVSAQTVPTPDHVVILLLENYGYADIIGNTNSPYINSLVSDPNAALFTQSFALSHPSQPNYIMFYSGNNQGVTTDNTPTGTPYTTCNLGANLISHGKTFTAFSEGLPSVGSLTSTSGSYARKHCPWTNWQGSGTNQVPTTVSQKFSSFPTSTTYSALPQVSFVIPNLDDDMHNPTVFTAPTTYSVTAITNGDAWVNANLNSYVQWAKTHNSLLILTFDEDDGSAGVGTNQITTIFIGQMVQGGSYPEHIDHYSVLRTIEDMYGLTYCGASSSSTSITDCWKTTTGINNTEEQHNIVISPNPAENSATISLLNSSKVNASLSVFTISGQAVNVIQNHIKNNSDESFVIDIRILPAGIYYCKVLLADKTITRKLIISK